MLLRLLTYISLVVLLAACKENNDPRLDLWEAQMVNAPDSILTILEATDPSTLTTDHDRARYPLLLMMARDKCYLPLQPDSALNQATEYFHKKKDPLNEAKARYYAGLAERHVSNYQQAIWETLNAIDRAHEAADTFWMGRTHNLAYEVYLSTYDCRNAAIEADKAAIYFKCANALPFHRYALLEKAKALNYPVYEDGTPIGKGMPLLDSLKNIALNDKDSSLVANCIYHQCIYSFEANDYHSAEKQIDSLRIFSKDSILLTNLLPNIISMEIAKGRSPERLFREYEENLVDNNDTISYLYSKSRSAAAKHNWELAFHLSDSLLNYYEILFADKTFRSVDEIKENYNKMIIDNKQQENTHLRRSRTIILLLTTACIFSALLVVILIRRRNKRKEQETMGQLLEIASENEVLKVQIELQKKLTAENETLKEQLYDLSLKRASLLGNRIDTICSMAMEYYGCTDNQAYKNDIYNRTLKELKQLKSEKFLKDFEQKVNAVHNSILDRLQQQLPEVTKGNLRWIAMLIGGLHPRTISFLLDMKIQTLYSKRLRVRSYIEKSNAPDKEEFLLFFPKPKD